MTTAIEAGLPSTVAAVPSETPSANAGAPSAATILPKSSFGPVPTAPSTRLLPETAAKVPVTGSALSLAALNALPAESYQPHWNPFLSFKAENAAKLVASQTDPAKRIALEKQLGALGLLKQLVGPFGHPAELFQGKTLVPVQDIFRAFVAQRSAAEQAALAPIVAALPLGALLRTPAHQFNVDGRPDNRVLFFSSEPAEQQALLDLVADLGRQHKRVVVQWMHISDKDLGSSTQGGTLMDVLGGKLKFGSSHVSGFSTGVSTVNPKTGLPSKAGANSGPAMAEEVRTTLVTTNWGDRSRLDDAQDHYGVHLFAIDYQAGVHDHIPDETLAAYKRNADMWDCLASLHVKFSSDGDTFGYNTYEWNPLEVHDRASARDIAWKLASDWDQFSLKHGSFYCAEAQYSIANLGPQDDTLLKKSAFGATKAGKLIQAFGEAPGYAGKPIEWCRQNPEIGWQHLIDLAASGKDGIKADWLFPLLGVTSGDVWNATYSNRQTVFLEFIPEHIKGWQAYRPRNPNHLIANSMTTGMITWALLHQYLPTEGITVLLLCELVNAYNKGDTAVRAAITALAGGADPMAKNGQVALAVLCSQLAGGFVLASLEDKTSLQFLNPHDTQGLSAADVAAMQSYAQLAMLKSSGYGEITTEADKAKVRQVWDQFIGAMKDPSNWSLEQLRAAVHAVDAKAAKVEVERKTPSGALAKGLMTFVPPGAWGFWAQQPQFCQSYAVGYVATGLHRNLAKATTAPL